MIGDQLTVVQLLVEDKMRLSQIVPELSSHGGLCGSFTYGTGFRVENAARLSGKIAGSPIMSI